MKWTRKCIWNSFIGCWLPIHSLSCDRIFFTRFGLLAVGSVPSQCMIIEREVTLCFLFQSLPFIFCILVCGHLASSSLHRHWSGVIYALQRLRPKKQRRAWWDREWRRKERLSPSYSEQSERRLTVPCPPLTVTATDECKVETEAREFPSREGRGSHRNEAVRKQWKRRGYDGNGWSCFILVTVCFILVSLRSDRFRFTLAHLSAQGTSLEGMIVGSLHREIRP